jgi:hypothetical protein
MKYSFIHFNSLTHCLKRGGETMRGAFSIAILMIIAAATMGCTDSFIPCTVDEDCTIDWGLSDNDAAHNGPGMVCNLEVSPFDRCQEMLEYLSWVPDWLPIPLPDCDSLPTDPGVCESSWGWF